MFKSQQLLANRWRLDHQLPSLQQIQRWIAWDTHNQTDVEVLTLTATEAIEPTQPNHFLQTHQQTQQAHFVGTDGKQPFAVYPLPSGEFSIAHKLPTTVLPDFTVQILTSFNSDLPILWAEEIVQYDTEIRHRPLGQVLKQSSIQVQPLVSPHSTNQVHYSLAMLLVQNQHPTLKWSSKKELEDWVDTFDTTGWFPDYSEDFQRWLVNALRNNHPKTPDGLGLTVVLPPVQVQHKKNPPTPTQRTQLVSSASRDIPLPKYVLMAHKIASPSIAKQLAAVAGFDVQTVLQAYEDGTPLAVDGGVSLEEANRKQSRYQNVPVTLSVEPAGGVLARPTVSMGLTGALLGGIGLTVAGLGWIPLMVGGGAWLLGTITRAQHRGQRRQQWKNANQVGIKNSDSAMQALQAARRRVLLSELPTLAIQDFIQQIDELEVHATQNPDMVANSAAQIFIEEGELHTAVKKSLQQTESFVKSTFE